MPIGQFGIKLPPQMDNLVNTTHQMLPTEPVSEEVCPEVPVEVPVEVKIPTVSEFFTVRIREKNKPQSIPIKSPTPIRENFLNNEYTQMATPTPQFNMLV
jgi:hypothetical protein